MVKMYEFVVVRVQTAGCSEDVEKPVRVAFECLKKHKKDCDDVARATASRG